MRITYLDLVDQLWIVFSKPFREYNELHRVHFCYSSHLGGSEWSKPRSVISKEYDQSSIELACRQKTI